MSATLQLVDPSTNPFLSGRYAAVRDEITVETLPISGTLPTDLAGAYLRNGPNPRFTPLGSYTYPLEGDGMIHGVWIEDGSARYANRYVETQSLRAEERAGRALFGGIMTPAFVDTALLGDDPDPGWPFKLDAFINVVRHGGRLLALEEGTPPYELAPDDLRTIGRYDFGGGLPTGICAHPKIDPVTGEMIVFRYDVTAPFLTWSVIGPDGAVVRPPTPVDGVDRGYMIHDFAITERYVVLVVAPLVFDLDAMMSGGAPLEWQPDLGTRIALIPRDGGATHWVHTEAMWAWHYANAFEAGDTIALDFPWTTAPGLVVAGSRPAQGGFTRATIDLAGGTAELTHVDDRINEFPRIDDRLIGRPHRFVTVAERSGDPRLGPGEHDRLRRYDMQTGTSSTVDTGATLGEVTFAPRTGSTGELDGYYLAFATDLASDQSSLYVWDAAEFPAPPIAVVAIPQRVPNGLHGNWFAAGTSTRSHQAQ